MKVDIDGYEAFRKAMLKKKISIEKLSTAVHIAAESAENTAKSNAPRRRGYLVKGIKTFFSKNGTAAEINSDSKRGGASRYYDQYVEFGTKKTKAHPFMRPAQSEGNKVLKEEVMELVKKK